MTFFPKKETATERDVLDRPRRCGGQGAFTGKVTQSPTASCQLRSVLSTVAHVVAKPDNNVKTLRCDFITILMTGDLRTSQVHSTTYRTP
ncbi:hypothetical protein J6590_045576 [Homalodisca vitripennis]|nr:hypothetical protein J6590_045576 [Homalodisca vitripennis]